jgi:hypothetical protein
MKIRDYLPRKVAKKPIMANVPADLLAQVQKQLEKDGITLTDLLIASLKSYLDDSKKDGK